MRMILMCCLAASMFLACESTSPSAPAPGGATTPASAPKGEAPKAKEAAPKGDAPLAVRDLDNAMGTCIKGLVEGGRDAGGRVIENAEDLKTLFETAEKAAPCTPEALAKAVDFDKERLIVARLNGSGCSSRIDKSIERKGSAAQVKLTYVAIGSCEPFFMLTTVMAVARQGVETVDLDFDHKTETPKP